MHHRLYAIAIVAALAAATPAKAIELAFPVDCRLGTDCFIQNYVDTDPGPGARDYRCGGATYDGHKGTDIRLISTVDVARAVAVRAAAAGTVRGLRVNMPDILYTQAGAKLVSGRECGNGIVIDHGGGWQTQYCHLRRGSIVVTKGQRVARGARLGDVGYSGKAAFAHLHLTVRHKGRVLDPFGAGASSKSCALPGVKTKNLWSKGVQPMLGYRTGRIIETAFIGTVPAKPNAETSLSRLPGLTGTSGVLVFAARAIKLEKGDALRLSLEGPGGMKLTSKATPVDRAKARYGAFVGKKRRAKPWPAGRYRGRAEILRAGKTIDQAVKDFQIRK